MKRMSHPSREQAGAETHERFDQMCAQIDEFESLPEVGTTVPVDPLARASRFGSETDEYREAALDGQILGGLVAPF